MVELPVDTRLKTQQMIEDASVKPEVRGYLGISSIADPCMRKLWYGFRFCKFEEITPRQKRLFSRGHREEPIIVSDLNKIGIIHHSDQQEVVYGNGHIKGHCDGRLLNVPDAPKTEHLSEFKTANDKSFKEIKKLGIIASKPVYHGQALCYMHLLDLKRCLFVVVNKNDDDRYYERIHADQERAQGLLDRGVEIITSEAPPERRFKSTWYACKWCTYYKICHFGESVLENCRTCISGDVCDNGIWECSEYNIRLTLQQQLLRCNRYEKLFSLK